jgi:hypothetical protein
MSFLSLLPSSAQAAARAAVKALPPASHVPASVLDAETNGYLDQTPAKPSPLAIVVLWALAEPCTMALSYHPLDKRHDPAAGNARGEALALAIASPERRVLLRKAGCQDGPSYCPSFLAPKGWASGRSDVGQPIGLWTEEGREDAPARRPEWKPRLAWDAIGERPTASAVWTQEGWKA